MAQTAAEVLIEQGIEQGKAQGIIEGIEQRKTQGIIEGKKTAILQLLRLRFQNVPETLTDRIASIESFSDLDTLLEQATTAESLNEIQI